jgi:hypothetical protein
MQKQRRQQISFMLRPQHGKQRWRIASHYPTMSSVYALCRSADGEVSGAAEAVRGHGPGSWVLGLGAAGISTSAISPVTAIRVAAPQSRIFRTGTCPVAPMPFVA